MKQKKTYFYYDYTLRSSAKPHAVLETIRDFLREQNYAKTRCLWTIYCGAPQGGPFRKETLIHALTAEDPRLADCLENTEQDQQQNAAFTLCNYQELYGNYTLKEGSADFDRLIFDAVCHPPKKTSMDLCEYVFDGISLPGINAEPMHAPSGEILIGSFIQFDFMKAINMCFPSVTISVPAEKGCDRVIHPAYRELVLSLPVTDVDTAFTACTMDETGRVTEIEHREFPKVKIKKYLKEHPQ